jgi:hypothetical protein
LVDLTVGTDGGDGVSLAGGAAIGAGSGRVAGLESTEVGANEVTARFDSDARGSRFSAARSAVPSSKNMAAAMIRCLHSLNAIPLTFDRQFCTEVTVVSTVATTEMKASETRKAVLFSV